MSCPKLMEKLCSQFEIFDFFTDILYKIMRSKVYKICCFALKIRPWFLQELNIIFFLHLELLDTYTTVGLLINSIKVVQLHFFL